MMELAFDRFRIDTDRFELSDPEGRREVEPLALELLIYLIRNRDRLVTKDELHQVFWAGRFVSDAALSTLIKAARQAVGDSGRDQRLIETQHGRGFRFIAPVTERDAAAPAHTAPAPAAFSPTTDAAPSIAVLPFANLSGRQENDVIAEGVTEEITTGLSVFRWFTLIAQNSAAAFRQRPANVREIGAALGVDYVVEGSLNRDGEAVRVHVQLVETARGLTVWAARYDLDFDGLFSLLDRITAQVVGALQPQLLESERQRAARTAPSGRTAWQLFVQAQGLLIAPGREANVEARRLLAEALAREPGSARVEASIALTHLWDVAFDWTSDPEAAIAAAVGAATRAVAIAASDSWAWTALGACKVLMRDHDGAIAHMRQAIALDPNSALAHGTLALILAFAGEPKAALDAAARAHRLSPFDPRAAIWLNGESLAHFALGHYREALDTARSVTDLRPDYPSGWRLTAAAAAALGDDTLARAAIDRLTTLLPGHRLEHLIAALPFRNATLWRPYLRALARAGLPGTLPPETAPG